MNLTNLDICTYSGLYIYSIDCKEKLKNILKNDFVERAVFLNARNANKLWRVFKEQTKERAFIFKNTPTCVLLFLKTRL